MRALFSALLTLALGCWLHGPAAAQTVPFDMPGYFEVAGVAANDVLNVRAEPNGSAPILRTLAPGAAPVEVTLLDPTGRWGRVVAGESDGWVSMRFLAPTNLATLGRTRVPVGLSCFGTEPFWSFAFESDSRLRYASITRDGPLMMAITTLQGPAGQPGPPLRAVAEGLGTRLTVVITGGTCSDGMSDATHGYHGTAFLEDGQGAGTFLAGCCGLRLPE